MRSRRSSVPSRVDAGMTTAPIFVAARIVSQSSTWLPSMSRIRWCRRTPSDRSHPASCDDRADRSANVHCPSAPSCSTIHSAGCSGRSAARTPSNQSTAQLNVSRAGQRKSRYAVS
jgi:hypothetical protein